MLWTTYGRDCTGIGSTSVAFLRLCDVAMADFPVPESGAEREKCVQIGVGDTLDEWRSAEDALSASNVMLDEDERHFRALFGFEYAVDARRLVGVPVRRRQAWRSDAELYSMEAEAGRVLHSARRIGGQTFGSAGDKRTYVGQHTDVGLFFGIIPGPKRYPKASPNGHEAKRGQYATCVVPHRRLGNGLRLVAAFQRNEAVGADACDERVALEGSANVVGDGVGERAAQAKRRNLVAPARGQRVARAGTGNVGDGDEALVEVVTLLRALEAYEFRLLQPVRTLAVKDEATWQPLLTAALGAELCAMLTSTTCRMPV